MPSLEVKHSPEPSNTDGEAKNPGPSDDDWMTAITSNVTSLQRHIEWVLRSQPDVHGLQETRATDALQGELEQILKDAKHNVVWGEPLDAHRSVRDAKPGGVAIVSKHPLRKVRMPSQESDFLYASKRFVHAVMVKGKCTLHILCVYGYPGAAQDPVARANNELLLEALFGLVALIGNAPVLLLGDLNTNAEASVMLGTQLACGAIHDVALECARAANSQPEATCFVHDTSAGSRIDFVLANRVLAPALRSCEVCADSGLPTHKPVKAVFELSCSAQQGMRMKTPKPFAFYPDPDREADQHIAQAVIQPILDNSRQVWEAAYTSGDTDTCLAIIGQDLEQYLAYRSTGKHFVPKKCAGRGRPLRLEKKASTTPHVDYMGVAIETTTHRLGKLTRRVEELQRKLINRHIFGALPQEWYKMWQQCCIDGQALLPRWDFFWAIPGLPDIGLLRHIATSLRESLNRQHLETLSKRRNKWQEALRADWKMGARRAHSYIRGDRKTVAPVVPNDAGRVIGDHEEIDELMRDAWVPVFQQYDSGNTCPTWEDFATKYEAHIPQGCSMELGAMTPEELRSAIKRMCTDTAFGADGFTAADLKAMPDALLERLALLFDLIEMSGSWPEALLTALVTMIPKDDNSGGMRPTDLRPISVMSVVYRAWASARLRPTLEWQESWASDDIAGFRPCMGCDDVTWQVSTEVEHALLHGTGLCGFSVDLAKAFDRIPWDIAFGIAERMGLSQRIIRAMRSLYSQLRIRFRVGPFIGQAFLAPNGIIQGFPSPSSS